MMGGGLVQGMGAGGVVVVGKGEDVGRVGRLLRA